MSATALSPTGYSESLVRDASSELARHFPRSVALVGGVALGLAMVEGLTPNLIWRKYAQSEIRDEGGEWFALGGLGRNDADEVVTELDGILGKVDSGVYRSKGIRSEDTARALVNYRGAYRPEGMQLFGHSMGTVHGMHGARKAMELGYDISPFQTIVADGSPLVKKDVHDEKAARMVALAPLAGPVGKYLIETIQGVREARRTPDAIARAAANALVNTFNELSPRLYRTCLMELPNDERKSPLFLDKKNMARLITPDTTIYYLGDSDDKVVKTGLAAGRYAALAEMYGATFVHIATRNGHANVAEDRLSLPVELITSTRYAQAA